MESNDSIKVEIKPVQETRGTVFHSMEDGSGGVREETNEEETRLFSDNYPQDPSAQNLSANAAKSSSSSSSHDKIFSIHLFNVVAMGFAFCVLVS